MDEGVNIWQNAASAISRAAVPLAGSNAKLVLGTSAYVLLGALVLSPLLWVSVPPLVDYPNHLARMWILVHGSVN